MENSILNIAWEAGGSIPINAKLASRCDQGGSSSKIKIIYSTTGHSQYYLELDFNQDITADDKLALENALIKIQQRPSSLVNFKMPSGAVLKSEVPITRINT